MRKNTKSITSFGKYHMFSTVLDKWLIYKSNEIKESSRVKYCNSIEKHIKPELGHYYIEKITNNTIIEFISKKRTCGRIDNKGGLSEKTIAEFITIIRCSFIYATNMGIKTNCTFLGIGLKVTNAPVQILNQNEEQCLIAYINNHIDCYTSGVMICLFTGIRIGELCALKWSNIDLDNETITVDKTLQRLQTLEASKKKTHIVLSTPKSITSLRTIPIPDILVDFLAKIKPLDCLPDQFVLSNNRYEYIEPRTMQNRLKKILKEAGLNEINFHSLRHTFATRCVELGVDIKVLSEVLGHSSIKITMDKYVHNSMDFKKENINKLCQITV